MDLHETLPVGTYTVLYDDDCGQFFLERIDDFEIKGKIYGKATRRADRILRTFDSRSFSTGVLLSGEKGSGKTLLAKRVCLDAAAKGISTLVVNTAWTGEKFNAFVQMIDQPMIVMFDEFEKTYDNKEGRNQEYLLTLLDGVYPSKKLFLLTCNREGRIDSNFLNRPGRIFYALKFEGLGADFVREYCEDNLDAKKYIPHICSISSLFSHFNFDMLKAMVEDMNRYGESPDEVLEMLNAKPEYGDSSSFKIQVFKKDKCFKKEHVDDGDDEWYGNPLTEKISFYCLVDPEEDEYKEMKFTARDMNRLNADKGEYVYVNGEEEKLILKKQSKSKAFDYKHFFPVI